MADTTYSWLKIGREFLDSPEMKALRAERNGNTLAMAYIELLTFSIEYDGDLSCFGIYDDFETELSRATGIHSKTLHKLLAFLTKRNLLVSKRLLQLLELTGKETKSARRKRRYREKVAHVENREVAELLEEENEEEKVGHCPTDVPPYKNKEKDKEKDKEKERDNTPQPPSKGAGVAMAEEKQDKSKKDKTPRKIFEKFAGEDSALLEALIGFIEMREKKNKPLTSRAAKQALKALQKAGPPEEWVEIVDQTVLMAWSSFFPLERNRGRAAPFNGGSASKNPGLDSYFKQIQEHRGGVQ